MENEVLIKCECHSCGGTGLYVGIDEFDGAAVACGRCNGQGWNYVVFKKFTERQEKKGIIRVFKTSPGIMVENKDGIELADLGGILITDWLNGKQFERGTENRKYSCPRWWTQCTGGPKPEWDECYSALGQHFNKCKNFCTKSECWSKYDGEVPINL